MTNKISKKGMTLLEVVMAIGLAALLAGTVIVSLAGIKQTRMVETAQTIKTQFELARDFARTHGGDSAFYIKKDTPGGLTILRESEVGTDEETKIKDNEVEVFYKVHGDETTYQLGTDDHRDVVDQTIEMRFAQTTGNVTGPNKLDWLRISNGTKDYTLVIQNNTGLMYYDYEIDEEDLDWDTQTEGTTAISLPTFILKGRFVDTVDVKWTGSSVQPEIQYDAKHVKISGVYRATDPGRYQIVFQLKDPYSTYWNGASGSTEDVILEWTIVKTG